MGTIPLASASTEVAISLPEEKGDVADVNQSLISVHPGPAGLVCMCIFGNVLRIISSFCCMEK